MSGSSRCFSLAVLSCALDGKCGLMNPGFKQAGKDNAQHNDDHCTNDGRDHAALPPFGSARSTMNWYLLPALNWARTITHSPTFKLRLRARMTLSPMSGIRSITRAKSSPALVVSPQTLPAIGTPAF